ncbi:MAG: hypothetical protein KGN78_13235 [Actinomycetales bacterium]|nr:hypothetical protein [Actinomycetales bacterium]
MNIWDAGGDPDHGVCYECFVGQWDREHQPLEITEEFEMENDTCIDWPVRCTEPDTGPLLRRLASLLDYEFGLYCLHCEWNTYAPSSMRLCALTQWWDCEVRDLQEHEIPF